MNHDRAAIRWLLGLVGGLVLTLTVAAHFAGAQEPAGVVRTTVGHTKKGFVRVEIRDGQLTMKVHEAPLAAVLQEVARHANLRVFSHGEVAEQITLEFEDLSLDEAMRRLIGSRGHVLVYRQEGGESAPARLIEVRLYPAIAASPRPDGVTAGGPGAPQRLVERTPELRKPKSRDATRAPAAPHGVEPWVQAAQSGTSWGGRAQAIQWLGSLGGKEAAATLAALLQDPDASIRRQAALALARIGGPIAISALESGLADPASQVREQVIDALRRSNDKAAVAPLTRALLTDQDPRIRIEAAVALSRLEGGAIWEALRSALEDADPSVRQAVEPALQRWERSHGTARR